MEHIISVPASRFSFQRAGRASSIDTTGNNTYFMKWFLSITIVFLAVFASGYVIAQDNHTPPCRARTLDLRAVKWNDPAQYNSINSSWNFPSFSVDCGTDFGEVANPKGKMHTSALNDTTVDSCHAWGLWGGENESDPSTAQLAIDTFEHCVESCASSDPEDATQCIEGLIHAAVWTENQYIYQPLRKWLESVMGLVKSQTYICSILSDIMATYENQSPSDYNDAVAIRDYVICCVPCIPHDSADLSGQWSTRTNLRNSEIEEYNDTVKDPIATPIDTTEPSMHDLGLDSLVKYFGELDVNYGNVVSIITNASAYPNPTGEGTIISFSTSQVAYVTLGLYDILGVQVSSVQNFQNLIQPGNHAVPISLNGMPCGTYYARIMTSYGDVQTVKIVKE